MKENRDRVSMTRAFVYYARLLGNVGDRSSLDIYNCIRGACGKNLALANDLWAAHETLTVLALQKKNEALRALGEIYLEPFASHPERRVRKNEISMRVLRFALENHLDERTVYRRLGYVRGLWLEIREFGKQNKK